MLRPADPWQGGARQTTVVEALDAAMSAFAEADAALVLVDGSPRAW